MLVLRFAIYGGLFFFIATYIALAENFGFGGAALWISCAYSSFLGALTTAMSCGAIMLLSYIYRNLVGTEYG